MQPDAQEAVIRRFRRSLHVFPVNAGSCNGCEMELTALLGPFYELERFGITFTTSPRQADMLLVTGPVTRNLHPALLHAYNVMPEPRLVAAVGACACTGGVFDSSYAIDGPLDGIVPVDVYIPGCPPDPDAILHGLLTALGRAEVRLHRGTITQDR